MSIDTSKMPKLGFGLMRLPKTGEDIDLPQLNKMVDAYMTARMNYFDTAYVYHSGDSENFASFSFAVEHIDECLEHPLIAGDRAFLEEKLKTVRGKEFF